jgi:hypothetical protein
MHGQAPVVVQSIVHQSSAGVLFAAGYVHCITMDILLFKSASVPSPPASKVLKVLLTLGMFGPIVIGMVRHPTVNAQGEETMTLDDMSWGAVGQWVGVLSLLSYFSSYHFEFTLPPAKVGSHATEMQRSNSSNRSNGLGHCPGVDERGLARARACSFIRY